VDLAGAPVAGAEVVAAGESFLGTARTDEEGRFAIEGIPLSPSSVSVAAMAAHRDAARIEGALPDGEPIQLVLPERPPIPLLPTPASPPSPGRLGGRCARTDGGPLGTLQVLAVPLDEKGREIAPVASAAVDPRGFFEFPSLPPGPVHLLVLPARREHDPSFRLATLRAEVVAGETRLADVPFAAGSVAGVVQDASGRPVSGAVLRFSVRRGEEEAFDAGIARTGADGIFRIADLPECVLEIEAYAAGFAKAVTTVETSLGMTREVVVRLE
jgi:hypothetical protein